VKSLAKNTLDVTTASITTTTYQEPIDETVSIKTLDKDKENNLTKTENESKTVLHHIGPSPVMELLDVSETQLDDELNDFNKKSTNNVKNDFTSDVNNSNLDIGATMKSSSSTHIKSTSQDVKQDASPSTLEYMDKEKFVSSYGKSNNNDSVSKDIDRSNGYRASYSPVNHRENNTPSDVGDEPVPIKILPISSSTISRKTVVDTWALEDDNDTNLSSSATMQRPEPTKLVSTSINISPSKLDITSQSISENNKSLLDNNTEKDLLKSKAHQWSVKMLSPSVKSASRPSSRGSTTMSVPDYETESVEDMSAGILV
jgi:hypothetical protein